MAKKKEYFMDLMCRTCLTNTCFTKCSILTPETSYDGKLVLKVLNFCIPELHIDWNLERPAICRECMKRLNASYIFKNMCLKNDLKYQKKYLKKVDLNTSTRSVPLSDIEKTSGDTTENSISKDITQFDESTDVNQNETSISNTETTIFIPKKEKKKKIQGKKLAYKHRFTNKDCFGCKNHIRDGKYHSADPRNAIGEYICFICGKTTQTIVKMRTHVYTHLLLHECKICNKRMRDLHQLTLHLRTHTKQKPFECPECGKRFVQSFNLHQHLAVHNRGDKANRNMCKLCGKILSTKYNLKIHLTTHNIGYKPRCPICDKWFYTEAALVKHSKTCVTVKEESEIFISEPEFIKTEVPEYIKPEVPDDVKEESPSDDDVFMEETSSQVTPVNYSNVFTSIQGERFITKNVISFL